MSECASPRIRGALGSFTATFLSLGILIAYIIGAVVEWQILCFIIGSMPIVLGLAMVNRRRTLIYRFIFSPNITLLFLSIVFYWFLLICCRCLCQRHLLGSWLMIKKLEPRLHFSNFAESKLDVNIFWRLGIKQCCLNVTFPLLSGTPTLSRSLSALNSMTTRMGLITSAISKY